ncbi:MAG: hypothetical protein GY854_06160, partial [Deltaproteobacteria bacterium]|nr:hypothetical protein [Deltaproteobacteria bacterium]
GVGTYAVTVDGYGSGMPPDLDVDVDLNGQITNCTGTIAGTEESTMTLTVKDGTRPSSTFPATLWIRKIVGDGYTAWKGQTGGENGFTASGVGTYAVTVDGYGSGMPPDLDVDVDLNGQITNCTGTIAGTEEDTMILSVKDGTRPSATFPAVLWLRRLNPDTLTVENTGIDRDKTVQAFGGGSWDLTSYSDGLTNTVGSAPDVIGGDTLNITFTGASMPAAGESGVGTVTIKANGGSRPSSTVGISTTVLPFAVMGISGDSEFTLFAYRNGATTVTQTNPMEVHFHDPGDWTFDLEGSYGNLGITEVADQTARFDLSSVTNADWDAAPDYEFDIRLVGGGAYTVKVSLRAIDFVDFAFFKDQNEDGAGVVTVNANPTQSAYTWNALKPKLFDTPISLEFKKHAADPVNQTLMYLHVPTAVATNFPDTAPKDGTFTLQLGDGARQLADLDATLWLRKITPASLTLPNDGTGDSETLSIADASNNWDLSADLSAFSSVFTTSSDDVSITIEWADFALVAAGEIENAVLTIQADAGARPQSTVNVQITVEAMSTGVFDIFAEDGTTNLPAAREKMRYQTVVHADTTVDVGQHIEWTLTTYTDIFELVDGAGLQPNEKILQTKVDGAVVTYIPDDWGGTDRVISLTAGLMNGTTLLSNGLADLEMSVIETMDDIDVAILIDRSGSMNGDRWSAAMNGASIFSGLVNAITTVTDNGDGTWNTTPHRAGLYWFWGHNSSGYGPNFPNPTTPISGYTGGFHNTFEDNVGDTYQLPDGATLAKTDKISDDPPAGTLVQTTTPGHYTALGSGLLYCRNALVANDPGHVRERVILALSDGMENREPKIEKLFPQDPPLPDPPLWFRENGDAGGVVEDPMVRLYASAVLTGTNWADKLRDSVEATGGVGDLDVKHITDSSQFGIQIQKWFVSSFKRLFEFTAPDEIPDPELSQGEWNTHPVTVNMGVEKVVFYVLFGTSDSSKWEFGVVPPGQGGAIYTDDADLYPGVRCLKGGMYKMLIVDLPLVLEGHKHRWAGEWKMVVHRTGSGKGNYATGSLTRQDQGSTVDVVAPSKPRPGDKAKIIVKLSDQNGKPIKDAKVGATVHVPGMWLGHLVSIELGSNPKLIKALRRSRSKAALDTDQISDRVLRRLYEKAAMQSGKDVKVKFECIKSKGLYHAEVPLKKSGEYDFDISIEGLRKTSRTEIKDKIGNAVNDLRKYYTLGNIKDEKAFLKEFAGTKQTFKIEHREQLNVRFVPSEKKTEVQGYFINEKTIRFRVQPRNKDDILLGPGWADSISFEAPGVSKTWPAIDAGDASYRVDIPIEAKNPRFDRKRHAFIADRLRLRHPLGGAISPSNNELPLKGFGVTVMGVRVPITVYALIGNRRSKETHLAICDHAAKIGDKNKVFIHDLHEAQRCGYDTCEWCLPLVCNTDPSKMETHKPFCSRVRRISPKNRLEVRSWKQAKKLGFDGCFYCMRKYHKR